MGNSQRITWVVIGVLAIMGCGTSDVPEGYWTSPTPKVVDPIVSEVSPSRISSGHTVTIRGEYFEPGSTVVEIDDHIVEIVSMTTTEIVLRGSPAVSSSRTAELLVAQSRGAVSQAVEVTLIPSGTVDPHPTELPVEPRYTVAAGDRVYFTDVAGVFSIDRDGIVRRLVGAAQLNDPEGIALAPDGRLAVVNRAPAKVTLGGGSEVGAGSLWLIDRETAEVERVVVGLTDPTALAVDADGDYYVLEGALNRVRRVTGDPATIESFATVDSAPYGADLAVADGYVYVTSWTDSEILRVPQSGGSFQTFAVFADFPQGLLADGDRIFATGFFPNYYGASIVELDTNTGALSPVAAFDEVPFGNARDLSTSDGAYFVTDGAMATVMRVDSSVDARPIAAGLASPVGIAADSGTTWFAVAPRCTTSLATDAFVELRADGSSRVVSSLRCPTAIARHDGTSYVVTHDEDLVPSVVRIDSETGAHTTVIAGDEEAVISGLAVTSAGDILTSDSDNNILARYDATGNLITSVELEEAGGIGHLATHGSDVFVVDDAPAVYRAPASLVGEADVVADASSVFEPHGLGVDAAGSLLITDLGQTSLLRVDNVGRVSTLARFSDAPGMTTIDADGSIVVVSLDQPVLFKVAP